MRTFSTGKDSSGKDRFEYLPDLEYTPTTTAHECKCLMGEETKKTKSKKCVLCFGSGYTFKDPTSKANEFEIDYTKFTLLEENMTFETDFSFLQGF